ncbi:hypothetical protein [Ferrovibrio sp.]|uniref:hypothetical protein n=1 Tax=Ferrovibrio sp. TaxID=1917215 RepID=UPI0025C6EC26|nr:hypothetical protein [Ferrovibrio sp.]MBX3454063.1 hypothetical protein [Ferrovibrio sp.]
MGVLAIVAMLGLLLFFIGGKVFVQSNPAVIAKALRWGGGLLLAGLAVFLLVRGRVDMALLLSLGAGALFGVGRFGAIFHLLFGGGLLSGGRLGGGWKRARTGFGNNPADAASDTGGTSSDIRTAWLSMRLHHDSGSMTGEVLQGALSGRSLQSLDLSALLGLLRECAAADPQSQPLLEAYLDRRFGAEWREQAAADDTPPASSAGGVMTREQALDILGLGPDADAAAIREAHRRLMKKLHPDLGGSNYLAAQINRAKDLLLGE